MAVNRTSLSAGAVIRAVLLEDPEVAKRAKKVFPVITDEAELPYVVYRRAGLAANPQKQGQPGADEVEMEVLCYTARYSEGVELAEAVRGALDYVRAEHEGLVLRSCHLSDSEEVYQDDAYVQVLKFSIKV